MINELEKATNIDINGDGRIGGQPSYPPNYPPNFNSYGGPPNYPPTGYPPYGGPPNYPPYGGPSYPPPQSSNFNQPGSGLINELEKATNIDLNHDGRIGGAPGYPPNQQQFGGGR
jgi:hypothetical protein